MKNRNIVCLLMVGLLFLGCQNEKQLNKAELKESFYCMGGTSMNRNVSVYVGEDALLHMYDAAEKTDVVLCNKADCKHEPYDEIKNPDPTCNAAMNEKLFSVHVPVISDGYLYLFGKENLEKGVVYREELDGSNRTRLYTFDYLIENYNSVYSKDGIVYAEATIPIVTEDDLGGSGSHGGYPVLLEIELDSGVIKNISNVDKEKEFQNVKLLDKKGNKIFYSHSYRVSTKNNKNYEQLPEYMTIWKYDINSKKKQLIFRPEELEGMIPVGITEQALCVYKKETMEAFEISFNNKGKKKIYSPDSKETIYFVYQDKWIIGNMEKEEFYYLKGNKLKSLPKIVAFSSMFADFIEFYRDDGRCMAQYGKTFYCDEPEIIMERKE